MLIMLLVLLTLMSISLRIALVGLEMAYQVNKRVSLIQKKSKDSSDEESFLSTRLGSVAYPTKEVVLRSSIKVTKVTLRVLRFVVSTMRNLLCCFATIVFVVDVIVFLLIVAVAGYYMFIMNMGG